MEWFGHVRMLVNEPSNVVDFILDYKIYILFAVVRRNLCQGELSAHYGTVDQRLIKPLGSFFLQK